MTLKRGDRFIWRHRGSCGHVQRVYCVNQYGTFAECITEKYKYESGQKPSEGKLCYQ